MNKYEKRQKNELFNHFLHVWLSRKKIKIFQHLKHACQEDLKTKKNDFFYYFPGK